MNHLLAQVDLSKTLMLNSTQTVADVYPNPASFINQLMPNLFTVAALMVFAFVLFAGFKLILSPGDTKATEQSSKSIGYAIAGFFLLFGAYWFMQIIQVLLGVKILG
jgi:uncharacterized membrane protein YdbT with pleckstrin-like domain